MLQHDPPEAVAVLIDKQVYTATAPPMDYVHYALCPFFAIRSFVDISQENKTNCSLAKVTTNGCNIHLRLEQKLRNAGYIVTLPRI